LKADRNSSNRTPRWVWMVAGILCLVMAWSMSARAGAFQDAQSFGAAKNNAAIGALKGLSVNKNTVPGFTTASPPQTAYQNNPGALSNAGTTAAAKDKTGAGKFIIHSAATRAQFNFTANDPLMRGAKNIYKNAQALAGIGATSTSGACRNVTTTTPDLYRTYTCSTGKTSNVFSNHVCATGRTPDIFSNHACIVRNDPDVFANHRCYTGRRADVYKNYTCTKSRPVTPVSCDKALVVTATTRPYCYWNQALAGTRMYGIAGPSTYWQGYMDFTAQCRSPGGSTNILVHVANGLGDCDNFRWYRNMAHLNINMPPWPTGWAYAGAISMIKWSGYFYCGGAPASVWYQSNGCNGNNCSARFRVADGSTHPGCSDGSAIGYRRYGRRGRAYCTGAPKRGYGIHCTRYRHRRCIRRGYGWYHKYPTIIQIPNYQYRTFTWTRNHNLVTYHDQWVNQACR